MKILIFGGTQFLGRHIVESLKQFGLDQELTLFNRGKSNPQLFTYPFLQGDRYTDLDLLENHQFDVVIDCSGNMPENLNEIADFMEDSNPHYIFISSCSVYDHEADQQTADETAQLIDRLQFTNEDANNPSMEFYGLRKLLCENIVRKNFSKNTIIRPGLIVGPFDTTFRFPYWIERIPKGGEILAPGNAQTPTQFIDARDIADWICHIIQNKVFGDFNAVGDLLNFGDFFKAADQALQTNSQIKYAPESLLHENQVGCWMELPLWVNSEIDIFLRRSNAKAKDAGLKLRSSVETIRDTREWLEKNDNLPSNDYNLKPDKERQILNHLSIDL